MPHFFENAYLAPAQWGQLCEASPIELVKVLHLNREDQPDNWPTERDGSFLFRHADFANEKGQELLRRHLVYTLKEESERQSEGRPLLHTPEGHLCPPNAIIEKWDMSMIEGIQNGSIVPESWADLPQVARIAAPLSQTTTSSLPVVDAEDNEIAVVVAARMRMMEGNELAYCSVEQNFATLKDLGIDHGTRSLKDVYGNQQNIFSTH